MSFFDIDNRIIEASQKAMELCKSKLDEINDIQEYNQQKMIKAFQEAGVRESHFSGSTGYGYDDFGRDALDRVYAYAFDAEDALVRHNFASGTHTLTVALFGILRPNDTMLSVTGMPYDTIRSAIGLEGNYPGSLKDFGINFEMVDLKADGTVDYEAVEQRIREEKPKMVYIQRSRGYSLRPSLTIDKIEELCKAVREVSPETVIMVDNCYGEFVEKKEPLEVGADIIAGSLIKNPGGGIAPSGGYIAGRKEYIEMCSHRMTCAGVGREVGATLGHNRELYMGLFAAPHTVGEAIKTAVYASALLEEAGCEVTPSYREIRGDIIQCVTLGSEKALVSFCKGMQAGAPVDSFVSPEPWDMPGYTDKVVMAAGAFTNGASIELSADGPTRPPYAAWMQGGLNFESGKTGVMLAVQSMIDSGALKKI